MQIQSAVNVFRRRIFHFRVYGKQGE